MMEESMGTPDLLFVFESVDPHIANRKAGDTGVMDIVDVPHNSLKF